MSDENQLIEFTKWIIKWVLKAFVGLVALLLLGIGIFYAYDAYVNIPRAQISYASLKLGMTMPEVKYAKGHPASVVSTKSAETEGPWSKFYTVFSYEELFDRKESVEDYFIWDYPITDKSRLTIDFDDNGRVESIMCFSSGWLECPSIMNLYDGVLEERVKDRLGSPSREEIDPDSGVKTIEYERFNVRFDLKKQKVYRLGILNKGAMD